MPLVKWAGELMELVLKKTLAFLVRATGEMVIIFNWLVAGGTVGCMVGVDLVLAIAQGENIVNPFDDKKAGSKG
jgi:hypothetical protein